MSGALSRVFLCLFIFTGISACNWKIWNPDTKNQILPSMKPLKSLSKSNKRHDEDVTQIYRFIISQVKAYEDASTESIPLLESLKNSDPDSSYLSLLLAKEYLKSGKMNEGITQLTSALKNDPDNRDARILLANLHISVKKFAEARVQLDILLEKSPQDEQAHLLLALIEIEDRNLVKAEKILKKVLKFNSQSALAHFYLGRAYQFRQKKSKAITHYKKAMDLRSGFIQAGTFLGVLQEEVGDVQGALTTYSWLAEETDSATFHKRVGKMHLDLKNYDQALIALEDLERVDSSDLNNKMKIALIYIEMKRYDLAAKKLEKVMLKVPDNEGVRFYLAAVYEETKQFSKAAKNYSSIGNQSELYPEALRGLLNSLGKAKKSEDAVKKIRTLSSQINSSSPNGVKIYNVFISYLLDQKQLGEAREFLEDAKLKFTSKETFYYSEAILLEKERQYKKALGVMRSFLKLNPEHPGALNFIGYLLADLGEKLNEAEELIRKALQLQPKDPYIIDSLGWVLHKKGKNERALNMLKKAHSPEAR